MTLTRYKVVAEMAQAISGSVEFRDVLTSVAEQTAKAFDLSECCIYEFGAQGDTATPITVWSLEEDPANAEFIGRPLDLGEEPAMRRVLHFRELVETRIDDADLPVADRRWMETWRELSTLYVPLVFGDEVLGCLELVEKRYVRPFTDYDHEFAVTVAALAAMAIHTARMRDAEAAQQRRLGALLTASREVASAVDYTEVLAAVARTTAEALEADACYIHLYRPEQDAIVWQATWERYEWQGSTAEDIGTVYPLSEHPYDREALQTGRVIEQSVDQIDETGRMRDYLDEWNLKTFLTVPAIFEGHPLGILEVGQATSLRHFDDEELELARALGEQAAAMLLHRAQLPSQA